MIKYFEGVIIRLSLEILLMDFQYPIVDGERRHYGIGKTTKCT